MDTLSPIYDAPKHLIRTWKQHNLTIDEMNVARQLTDEDLQRFLMKKEIEEFWPRLTIEEWQTLVKTTN